MLNEFDMRRERRERLFKKVFEVLKAIQTIAKKGDNEEYTYLRAVDVVEEVRRQCLAQGLLFTTSVAGVVRWINELGTDRNGVTVETIHEFIDIETGEAYSFRSAGDGIDSGDKAIYKALTGAIKYALRDNLLISDPNADAEATPSPKKERPFRKNADDRRDEQQVNMADASQKHIEAHTNTGLSGGIPPADRMKLFKIAEAANPDMSPEAVTELVIENVKALGVETSKDLNQEQFDKLCDQLSKQKPTRKKK